MNMKALVEQFKREGYVVAPSLFSVAEIDFFRSHFMALNAAGHGFAGDDPLLLGNDDPLKSFPRIVHPHRFDQYSLDWLLDDRLREWTTALLGAEPFCRANDVLLQTAGRARPSVASRSDAPERAAWYLSRRLDGS